jgi:hypothetical protein
MIVSIQDLNGRVKLEQVVEKNQTLYLARINISSLSSGLYYLQIIQPLANKKLIRPFVKQ